MYLYIVVHFCIRDIFIANLLFLYVDTKKYFYM